MKSEKVRQWLILSHGFNMDGRAASLTITDKIPYLMEAGIQPVVLSAVTGVQDDRFHHEQLWPWGPSGFRFDLRHRLTIRWGKKTWRYRWTTGLVGLFLTPLIILERVLLGLQSQWSWMPAAVWRGVRLVRKERPELIYTTGGAYSAHWAGYWIKRLTGIPWIAEIHDPMVFPGTFPKTRNLKFWAKLEGMICGYANLVWWFTNEAMASARRRHPELDDRGFVVLPGADPPKGVATYERGSILRLGHFGSLSDVRTLKHFVEGFARFKEQNPSCADQIEVHCYGANIDRTARLAIEALGLQRHFIEHGRVERDEQSGLSGREIIQQIMHKMDGLLLIHGHTADCAEYIPSKFYDYLWAKRPIVALTHINPQLDELVRSHGGYAVEIEENSGVERLLYEIYQDWHDDNLSVSSAMPMGTREAVAIILKQVSERVALWEA